MGTPVTPPLNGTQPPWNCSMYLHMNTSHITSQDLPHLLRSPRGLPPAPARRQPPLPAPPPSERLRLPGRRSLRGKTSLVAFCYGDITWYVRYIPSPLM